MISFLLFAPYILVPLLMTLCFKRFRRWKGLTYLCTALLIFLYPFGLFWMEDYLYPPPPGPRCGNPQMFFMFGNVFFFLPLALIVQFVFNKLLGTHKKKLLDDM